MWRSAEEGDRAVFVSLCYFFFFPLSSVIPDKRLYCYTGSTLGPPSVENGPLCTYEVRL